MSVADLEAALAGLGAEDRALLELSVVREVADEDIASLLGVDADRVRSRREEALAIVEVRLGASSHEERAEILRELGDLPGTRWRDQEGSSPPSGVQAVIGPRSSGVEPQPGDDPPEPEPGPPARPELEDPGPEDRGPRTDDRAMRPLLLIAALAAVLLVAVVLVAGGGDDSGDQPAKQAQGGQSGQTGGAKAPKPAPGELTAPVGGGGKGSATITGSGDSARLDLTVRDLPSPARGGYVVWLYNSVFDSRALSGSLRGSFRVGKRLPKGYLRYRFIDVSREPADGNRNHSGQSVLRVPISSLGS